MIYLTVWIDKEGHLRVKGVKICRVEMIAGEMSLVFPDRNDQRRQRQGVPTCSVKDLIEELIKAKTHVSPGLPAQPACESDSGE